MTTFIFVTSFRRLMKSHVNDGDVNPSPRVLMPANMGLFALVPPPTRGFARLPVASSWQVAQLRVSVRCNRVMVSVFLPDGRSTVTATAVQPADSARLTNFVVTSKLSVV